MLVGLLHSILYYVAVLLLPCTDGQRQDATDRRSLCVKVLYKDGRKGMASGCRRSVDLDPNYGFLHVAYELQFLADWGYVMPRTTWCDASNA